MKRALCNGLKLFGLELNPPLKQRKDQYYLAFLIYRLKNYFLIIFTFISSTFLSDN